MFGKKKRESLLAIPTSDLVDDRKWYELKREVNDAY